ncbi:MULTISPECIES: acetyltransferase [Chitinophaga]|uniref:acetyltransferase n=1 Tax=Chitinophaga TaxID=79328 RepID=UPI00115815ED|nr:acetyltransferase [Chitinophaga polysaccharea]
MLDKYRTYGLAGFMKLAINVLRTKIFFPKARLIRFPFDIRNSRNIQWQNGFTTGVGCRLEAYPETSSSEPVLIIGTNVQINDYVHISAGKKVIIGNNVLIASKIFITDISHGSYGLDDVHDHPDMPPSDRMLTRKEVVIEDNVWIGEYVSVLPGAKIGKGSIIGAMSVVTREIPPYCIAVGSPARVIKKFNFETHKWEKLDNI